MKRCSFVLVPCVLVVLACLPGSKAFAAVLTVPRFGGGAGHQGFMVMPEPYVDSFRHVRVPIDDDMAGPSYTPQLTPEKPGDVYENKWSVLNGMAYCKDYGWYDSLSNLYEDQFKDQFGNYQYWWIELVDHSPGLVTYDPVLVASDGLAKLIFSNNGDRWMYPGGMLHNVYAIPNRLGVASATYHVYVGDIDGVIDNTIAYGTVAFNWNVPEPASLALLACAGLTLLARRKRPRSEAPRPGTPPGSSMRCSSANSRGCTAA
jgi:hypothetical protein